ncbi:hypothetical protein B566_EDAN006779 [Ephemera danica]|nr:hypothetical protein B566_EDAN006779 [Ephemera danica]
MSVTRNRGELDRQRLELVYVQHPTPPWRRPHEAPRRGCDSAELLVTIGMVKSSATACHSKRKDLVKPDTKVTLAMPVLEFNTSVVTFLMRMGGDGDVVSFFPLFCVAEEDEPEVLPDFEAASILATSIVANFMPAAWPQDVFTDVRMPGSNHQEIEPCNLLLQKETQRLVRRGQFEIAITKGNKGPKTEDMPLPLASEVRDAHWFEVPIPWKQEPTWTRVGTPDGRVAGKYWGQTLKLTSRWLSGWKETQETTAAPIVWPARGENRYKLLCLGLTIQDRMVPQSDAVSVPLLQAPAIVETVKHIPQNEPRDRVRDVVGGVCPAWRLGAQLRFPTCVYSPTP